MPSVRIRACNCLRIFPVSHFLIQPCAVKPFRMFSEDVSPFHERREPCEC